MLFIRTFILVLGLIVCTNISAQLTNELNGNDIIKLVQDNKHSEKAVYEELSVILTDELGNRDTRRMRKYVRLNDQLISKYLLVFDFPEEFHGVALLVNHQTDIDPDITVYLPAYGQIFKHSTIWKHGETIFGTDFSIRDLVGGLVENYQYVRRKDRKIENISFYVVDVFLPEVDPVTAAPLMKHYVQQDKLTITRTDYLDRNGKVLKQMTKHNLSNTSKNTWNAAMMLMVDRQKDHRTLIKVNKRILSEDYVPEKVFTENWLYENHPPLDLVPLEEDELETELMDASNTVLDKSLVIMQSDLQ
ncbi:MAG: outer membrane lipoprotein-sorting protein [Gammaproteobacteria bacterium]|jgi:hypothetical protein